MDLRSWCLLLLCFDTAPHPIGPVFGRRPAARQTFRAWRLLGGRISEQQLVGLPTRFLNLLSRVAVGHDAAARMVLTRPSRIDHERPDRHRQAHRSVKTDTAKSASV